MTPPRLILASASPRRKDLLTWAGVDFDVAPSRLEETIRNGETPEDYVQRTAREKAEDVSGRYPKNPILSADTVVTIDGLLLGKPLDRPDAARMLGLLSGRQHRVITGFNILQQASNTNIIKCVTTRVTFRRLSSSDVDRYIDSGEVWDKAGAYAVQGQGASLTTNIDGSYTNVIGLPLDEVIFHLVNTGIIN